MNGTFQGAAAFQQSYAQQIGQGGNVYGGGYQGQRGDRGMSSVMNMGSAVGGPLAAGAMGMLGLDPMSLGLKAGLGAFAGGAGFGGAMAAGGAVALPLMAAGAAVNYAGSQMYEGAQQQMGLNQQLRGGFNFRNQYGGQGFSRTDMTAIGGAVREMSEQFGPGGEIASFKELSGLAGKMGSMGFAQGVRDVKDFTSRFKDMVKTLKTMATDLGTTLEGAMEFAQAAKGSGVFGMNRVQGFTAAARATSISGGLALSEVTGAASIGSQISRSMGGLGRQGANAGMKTIGQIGTAQQMGLLSEEDIYNVTGLTGAEGRQAMATSAMQSTGRFLQSGRGRRMLASMAGKDGTLDPAAVQQFMSGGMSISETMRQDKSHLGAIGRANFIRNEGRLRGAAMEAFGGFGNAMQLMSWAQEKGVDINSMDDRSMLFAQRQLGMGRDEVDQAVMMAGKMPQIMEQERRSGQQQQYFDKMAQARKGQGIEGVQQRFQQAKETINSKLQKVGQDIFNQGSESIDSFFNKLFGTYVETYSKDIDSQIAAMRQGGASGRAAGQRAFGVGGRGFAVGGLGASGHMGGARPEGIAAALGRGSAGGFEESLAADWGSRKGLQNLLPGGGLAPFLTGQTMTWLLHGQSGEGKLKDLGYNIKGMSDQQVDAKLLSIQAQQQAAATGFDPAAVNAAKGGDFLSMAYAMKTVTGKGDDRQDQIETLIRKQATGGSDPNSTAARAMVAQLDATKGDRTAKAALIGNYERAQKVDAAVQLGNLTGTGGMSEILAKHERGGYGSASEENKAFAKELGVSGFEKGSWRQRARDFLGRLPGAKETDTATEWETAAGEYGKSDAYRNMAATLFGGDKEAAAAARTALMQDIQSQTGQETGKTEVQRNLLASVEFDKFMRPGPDGKLPTQEEQEAWASNRKDGVTLEGVKGALHGVNAVLSRRQEKDYEEGSRRIKAQGVKDLQVLGAGIMDATTGRLSVEGAKGLSEEAQSYVNMALKATSREAAEGMGAFEGQSGEWNAQRGAAFENLSVADQRAAAARLAGSSEGGRLSYQVGIRERLNRNKKGRTGSVLDELGLGKAFSADELKNFGGNPEEMARQIIARQGVDPTSAQGVQEDLVRAFKEKGTSGAAAALASVTSNAGWQDASKKKSLDAAEAADPLQAAIKANGEKTNKFLEVLVRSNKDALAELIKGNSTSSDDPEKPGTGTGTRQ